MNKCVRAGRALPQNFVDRAAAVRLKTNPTGGNDDEAVQQARRHDLARALAPRYVHASRREKGELLDEFCATVHVVANSDTTSLLQVGETGTFILRRMDN